MNDIRIGDMTLAWFCPDCDTKGKIPNPAFCDYFYRNQDVPEHITCDTCEGRGYILTSDGLILLRFLDIFRSES